MKYEVERICTLFPSRIFLHSTVATKEPPSIEPARKVDIVFSRRVVHGDCTRVFQRKHVKRSEEERQTVVPTPSTPASAQRRAPTGGTGNMQR